MRTSAVALVLLVAACGSQGAVVQQAPPAPSPTATPVLRPCEDGETTAVDGCFDPDAGARANRAFRDRIAPTADDLARAQAALPQVRAALLPTRKPGVTVETVTAALKGAGLPGYGVPPAAVVGVPQDGVGVSVEYGSACVFGSVTATQLQLDAGGVTNEGSCLPGVGGH